MRRRATLRAGVAVGAALALAATAATSVASQTNSSERFIGIGSKDESRHVVSFRRCGQDDAFGAGLQVQSRFFFVQENTGAFQNYIYIHGSPGQFSRVTYSQCSNFGPVNGDAGVI